MVGRFIGAWLLRLFAPGKVLACAAAMVIILLTVSANTVGAHLRDPLIGEDVPVDVLGAAATVSRRLCSLHWSRRCELAC